MVAQPGLLSKNWYLILLAGDDIYYVLVNIAYINKIYHGELQMQLRHGSAYKFFSCSPHFFFCSCLVLIDKEKNP